MRKLSLIVVTLCLLLLAGGVAANAQITDRIEAKIPFAFTVGNTTLPAGKYTVKALDTISEGVMEISNDDGTMACLFLIGETEAAREPKQTELIFNRIGDRYFLSELFEKGNSVGVEVQKSKVEKRLEKEGAMVQTRAISVLIQ